MYPDGTSKITVCNKPIFKDSRYVSSSDSDDSKIVVSKPKNMTNEVRPDSVKRAKEAVFDIALCNEWNYFVTLTLDFTKIDRYDSVAVSKAVIDWFKNMVKRHDVLYLLLPEKHKDGAIHMHALMKGELDLDDSGKKTKDGKVIYNLPQWIYGFSTAIEITGDPLYVAKYITKYVTKDMKKIFGKFYYAGGKGLQRKPSIKLYDIYYDSVNSKEYLVDEVNLGFKYITESEKEK